MTFSHQPRTQGLVAHCSEEAENRKPTHCVSLDGQFYHKIGLVRNVCRYYLGLRIILLQHPTYIQILTHCATTKCHK